MARDDRQHIEDLAEMLCREAEAVGGWGSVVVRISYSEHLPRQVDVVERHPSYRIGKCHPPLTGRPRLSRLTQTE